MPVAAVNPIELRHLTLSMQIEPAPETAQLDDDEAELQIALQEERARFEKMTPLPTFLILSIGPLLMQVGSALHDSIDFLLISRAYGSYGVGVVGLASLIRYACEGISFFFAFAAIIKLPMLIGEGRQIEARQFIVDLYRVGFVLSILFAILIYFLSEPMLRYMGCPEAMLPDSMGFITPIAWSIPLYVLLQISMGVIQGEGRAVLCGLLQLSVFVFNVGVVSPILFFGIEVSLKYTGLPYVFSRGIPSIILVVLVFSGKFSLKPKLSLCKNAISKNVWHGLGLASSYLLFLAVNVFPPMFLVHYLLLAASNIGEFGVVNPAFNTLMKIQVFVFSWIEGFSQGFMAAGSYASGAAKIRRFIRLSFWGFIFCLGSQLIFMPLTLIDPWVPSRIWLSSPEEKAWSRKINGIPFYTQFLQAASEITNCICMSAGKGWAPLIPAIIKGVVEIGAVQGMYDREGGSTDPRGIVYVYNILDGVVLVVDIVFWIVLVRPYFKSELEKVGNEDSDDQKEKLENAAVLQENQEPPSGV
jgi:Na+-driven multidrug efflux pump